MVDHVVVCTVNYHSMPPCHSSMSLCTRQLFLPHYTLRGVDFLSAASTLALYATELNLSPRYYFHYCVPLSRSSWFWSKPRRSATKPRPDHCVPLSRSTRFGSRPSCPSTKPRHSHRVPLSRSTQSRSRPWIHESLSARHGGKSQRQLRHRLGMWILSWSRGRLTHSHHRVVNPHHHHHHHDHHHHHHHHHCVPPSRSCPSSSRPWRRLTRLHHRVVNPHHNHCVPLSRKRSSPVPALAPVDFVAPQGGQPSSQPLRALQPQPSVLVMALAPVDLAAQPPRAFSNSYTLNALDYGPGDNLV